MKTKCCNYNPPKDQPYPVMWNPYNKVVQCHNCGTVYEPSLLYQEKSEINVPIAFERLTDEELFTINEDEETYSLAMMKEEYPDSLYLKYKAAALNDPQYFKPIY